MILDEKGQLIFLKNYFLYSFLYSNTELKLVRNKLNFDKLTYPSKGGWTAVRQRPLHCRRQRLMIQGLQVAGLRLVVPTSTAASSCRCSIITSTNRVWRSQVNRHCCRLAGRSSRINGRTAGNVHFCQLTVDIRDLEIYTLE